MLFFPVAHSITVLESPYICNLEIYLSLASFIVSQSADRSALLFVALPNPSLKDILFVSSKKIIPPAPPMGVSP